jgi:hypothetical protein
MHREKVIFQELMASIFYHAKFEIKIENIKNKHYKTEKGTLVSYGIPYFSLSQK